MHRHSSPPPARRARHPRVAREEPGRRAARRLTIAAGVVVGFVVCHATAWAQNTGKGEPKVGWSNSTNISLVVTAGNSAARTLGFEDHLRHVWANARFEFDVTGVKSATSDDRYFLVEPGLEFLVGSSPPNPSSTLISPGPEPDVNNLLIGGHYQRNIRPRFFWTAGARWDRNTDAGILHRSIVFAGVGHTWADNDRRRFATGYSFSYTDRLEEDHDPEKEPRFGGIRANGAYTEHLGTTTTVDSAFVINVSLADTNDFSIDTTQAVSVKMNGHLSLKASVQWLYEHEPALETDLDVVAYAEVVNPDGLPGTGDEYYRTLESGGTKLVLGSRDARKNSLDTIVRTALVISF